jgi:hypothetical protein
MTSYYYIQEEITWLVGVQGREGWFIQVDRGFHGVPVVSRVFQGTDVTSHP